MIEPKTQSIRTYYAWNIGINIWHQGAKQEKAWIHTSKLTH